MAKTWVEQYRKQPYLPMDDADIWAFLEAPTVRTMAMATVGKDGMPSNSIIWFFSRDRKIYFKAYKKPLRKKTRDILNFPWVSCTVDNQMDGFDQFGMTILGKARVIERQEEIDEFQRHFYAKYMASGDEERHAGARAKFRTEHVKAEHAFFEIVPEKVFSWDRRKWLTLLGEP